MAETIIGGAGMKCDVCQTIAKLGIFCTAGFYIGTECDCGPYSRETEYFKTRAEAEKALEVVGWLLSMAGTNYHVEAQDDVALELNLKYPKDHWDWEEFQKVIDEHPEAKIRAK